jgi:hypothetical protein
MGEKEIHRQFNWKGVRINSLDSQRVHGRMILKWTPENCSMRVWAGLMCLRIGIKSGLLWKLRCFLITLSRLSYTFI